MAAISAPNPPVTGASWSTRTFEVFRTEAATVEMSQGIKVRRSITSMESPSTASFSAARAAHTTPTPYVTTVASAPSRVISALPIGRV